MPALEVVLNCENTGCLKIREFRIQSVVGKDPVEPEKYLEKKKSMCLRRHVEVKTSMMLVTDFK
jgi:hypothetical protein